MPYQKNIAYLFGAGATHAELQNSLDQMENSKRGLLIGQVSKRVIERARRNKSYLKDLELVSATKGSLNIELLISLVETSKVYGWEKKTKLLKDLVRRDIQSILTPELTERLYLHKALFKLHDYRTVQRREQMIGCISLNYDHVLDLAYRTFFGEPNYCFFPEQGTPRAKRVPLLKLHGSFDWHNQPIRGRTRNIEIIPLGTNKSYLHFPYGSIWNRALEVLIECDTLRVIGCSLSQNDIHLIDLLFKAHLERNDPFEIELIAPQEIGERIRTNYGFLPRLRTLREIENDLIPDDTTPNPFKTWLKYKILRMVPNSAPRIRYLKSVIE